MKLSFQNFIRRVCRAWPVPALLLASVTAEAKLNVVATLPDLAAVAREIGGDHVKVTSLARGTEDPHFVDAKPSFIRVLNRADILIEGGAELEIGWLPPLVKGARNRDILPGGKGRIAGSLGVPLLEVPTGPIDRSQGDVHASGNPHYLLDPVNAKILAAQLARIFAENDADHAGYFAERHRDFAERIDTKLKEWTERLAPLRGTRIVEYHKNFEYFTARFGLVISGQIEPKPGIPPSPTHVARLIPDMKAAGVKLVIAGPNRSPRTPQYVADKIGAKLLILPIMAEGHPRADTYIHWIDYLVNEIVAAVPGA